MQAIGLTFARQLIVGQTAIHDPAAPITDFPIALDADRWRTGSVKPEVDDVHPEIDSVDRCTDELRKIRVAGTPCTVSDLRESPTARVLLRGRQTAHIDAILAARGVRARLRALSSRSMVP